MISCWLPNALKSQYILPIFFKNKVCNTNSKSSRAFPAYSDIIIFKFTFKHGTLCLLYFSCSKHSKCCLKTRKNITGMKFNIHIFLAYKIRWYKELVFLPKLEKKEKSDSYLKCVQDLNLYHNDRSVRFYH